MEKETLEERIDAHNIERRQLMIESIETMGINDAKKFIDKGMPQSLLFMIDIIPKIHRLYEYLPEGELKTVLDVGPQNFAGTQLLATTHMVDSFCRLKLKVSAIDITNQFGVLRKIVAPEVEFLVNNIFDIHNRKWDFVIASHVIEHVEAPYKFIDKLRQLTNDFVIVAAPWEENPLVTPGHVNTINKEFVRKLAGRDLKIFTSYSWGKNREVCTFWVPGSAHNKWEALSGR